MGALVAGVALSTFPYTLDVAAKVTSLRDFFLTLFFVAMGMTISWPTPALLAGTAGICGWVIVSRLATVTGPLLGMAQGHRTSLVPAINLCQVSEFSLVILALGYSAGHVSETSRNLMAYAFILLAVLSTYAIVGSDALSRRLSRRLQALGLTDLNTLSESTTRFFRHPSIFLLGFSWTASSLLEEILRNDRVMLGELRVIDFNPHVNQELRRRGVDVVYGDISQRDTLEHAGVPKAKIIICSLSNTVLKGTTNLRLVTLLRELNPDAKIIAYSELFNDIPRLRAAGADYVCLPRLMEAVELWELLQAAKQNLLDEKRAAQDQTLQERHEVIP
jgi:hypothetical protein